MKTDFLTIEEVDQAITAQENAKDTAIQQANFHSGYIACLKEIRERMVATTEEQQPAGQESPAEGSVVPIKPAVKKTGK